MKRSDKCQQKHCTGTINEVHYPGVILDNLFSGFQNNCNYNYHGKSRDLWKEELFLVVVLWSRESGERSPPGLLYF